MTPLETAYAAALDELSAAHADTIHLHDEVAPRHPLAPMPFTRQRAIDVMHRAAAASGLRWVVVYDRGYFVVLETDAECWHPRDARIAQSHCDGCNALLTEALTAFCAVCGEAAKVAA